MKTKPDIITFSGDKLIGGPQSGIIVGKQKLINMFQKNTLYRTLRPDKLTIGLLEETLRTYRTKSFKNDNLSLSMLNSSKKILKARGKKVIKLLKKSVVENLGVELISSKVEAGSGSLPEKKISSIAIAFNPKFIEMFSFS